MVQKWIVEVHKSGATVYQEVDNLLESMKMHRKINLNHNSSLYNVLFSNIKHQFCNGLDDFASLDFLTVKSVQEACAKCFVVHILKFEILQNT